MSHLDNLGPLSDPAEVSSKFHSLLQCSFSWKMLHANQTHLQNKTCTKLWGFIFFKPTPPFSLTKSGSQTKFLNLQLWVANRSAPRNQNGSCSTRCSRCLRDAKNRKDFWKNFLVAGNGFGEGAGGVIKLEMSTWATPVGEETDGIFRSGFSSSASVQGESNPLLFVVSLFMSGPCLCNCFNTSPKSDSTHENKSIKCHQHGSVWLDIPRDVTVLWQVNGFVVINRWEVVAWTGCCFASVCKTSSFH